MKEIKWRPISEEVQLIVPKPIPVAQDIPDWYKNVPKFQDRKNARSDPFELKPTLKACAPFLDPFMTGYVQRTWCDIYIEADGEDYKWRYAGGPEIMGVREGQKYLPQMQGMNSQEFVWKQVWIPELPRGYSMLYTHPFNRYELPYLSLTGIIDNDHYFMENVANHPFLVRDGFSGYLPQGSPMFQMIPVKRDAWRSQFLDFDYRLTRHFKQVRNSFFDGYKKLYWQRKSYE